jgi:sec-independent protein translocase protein TatA
MLSTLGLFGTIGTWEAVVIAVVLLLLFGRRLPEVGKSLGKGIVEFKKGLKGIEDEIEIESNKSKAGGAGASSVARPPLTAGGQDVRVSRADADKVVDVQGEPGRA